MKGTSKVIMGATLLLAVSLAMVLVLILVLLAELYCSLLLRRRRLRTTATAIPTATTSSPSQGRPSSNVHESNGHDHDHHDHRRDVIPPATTSSTPLSSFYAPGVLQAPRSLLFPVVPSAEKQSLSELHPHQLVVDIPEQTEPAKESEEAISASSTCGNGDKHFVYISNPIYENADSAGPTTPFETPDSSPSRLEEMGGSGSSSPWSSPLTPPLTPMKKLPAEASSVSLGDGRSIGTESDSNNGLSNSSSSATPCTSPSW